MSIPDLQRCTLPDANNTIVTISSNDPSNDNLKCTETQIFFILDVVCAAWFTLEVILRLIACPTLKQYFTSPLNIIDVLAVIPFYVELLIVDYFQDEFFKARAVFMFLRILRVIRIFRILKLARYLSSLRILGSTLKSAMKELNMLFLFIMLAMFIFANLMYQLENDFPGSSFTSIPASFW